METMKLWSALTAPVSRAVPTPTQLLYQQRELSVFLHFSICTFAGCEQNACHSNPPSLFNPDKLNATQWVDSAMALGAKQICLTARHSGGFALWPTAHTNYSVAHSPWRSGKGDVIAEFVQACRERGMSPCLYFIADWDCFNADEPGPVYLRRQLGMLSELLTGYGTIDRLWLDFYGAGCGRAGKPPLCPAEVFPSAWMEVVAHVRRLSPSTMMLPGPDGCENPKEAGIGVYPLVNMIENTSVPHQSIGHPEECGHGHNDDPSFQGDANCSHCLYTPHESDLSIQNPGDAWFWRPSAVHMTASKMWDNYLWTVGRGSHLILNLPPNSSGLIPQAYTNEARRLGEAVHISFGTEAALVRLTHVTPTPCSDLELELRLPPSAANVSGAFDAVVLQEDLAYGQVVLQYSLEVQATNGTWLSVVRPRAPLFGSLAITGGLTIGQKLIDRFAPGPWRAARFRCVESIGGPGAIVRLASVGLHKMRPPESSISAWRLERS